VSVLFVVAVTLDILFHSLPAIPEYKSVFKGTLQGKYLLQTNSMPHEVDTVWCSHCGSVSSTAHTGQSDC
jgi:hypothetical protein